MSRTPEDFLAFSDSMRELVEAFEPIFEIVATIRRGFIEASELGPEAADQATVMIFAELILPQFDGASKAMEKSS